MLLIDEICEAVRRDTRSRRPIVVHCWFNRDRVTGARCAATSLPRFGMRLEDVERVPNGFTFRYKDGRTGRPKHFETADDAEAFLDAKEEYAAAEMRKALEGMTVLEVERQADYWLARE